MMYPMSVESLESRKLLSASTSATGKTVATIGATSGVTAASVTRTFDHLYIHSSALGDKGTTDADLDTTITITFSSTPDEGGLNADNLVRAAVKITPANGPPLTTTGANSQVSKLKTSGGGDVLVIQLKGNLIKDTTYSVEVDGSSVDPGDLIRDVDGNAFADFTGSFTTGEHVAVPTKDVTATFTQSMQSATNEPYTATAIGPDHRLYAATTNGTIYSFAIAPDGTLSGQTPINVILDNNKTSTDPDGNRIITGITFDPGATAGNLVMWVSHGAHQFGNDGQDGNGLQDYAPNFSGKISRINFNTTTGTWDYQDIIVNIPRSVKDHMNNQIVFQPGTKKNPTSHFMYFGVAAMNAMGDTDGVWGNRPENIYSATIMQLRLGAGPTGLTTYLHTHGTINLLLDNKIDPSRPNDATGIDANGKIAGTHYNIFSSKNPLRIYADGIRNDFDMVFASNGHLYAAINGSSSGGDVPSTPADLADVPTDTRPDKDVSGNYSGGAVTRKKDVKQIEEDSLLDVTNGVYYGHPDPARAEYVLDAGYTGNTSDPYQFRSAYPSGQVPDRNYTRPIYDFGEDYSPDGILQYTAVNGANSTLNGYLLTARYSSGGDILGLKTNADGSIDSTHVEQNIPGLSGLGSPLDIVEDMKNGNLYATVLSDEVSGGSIYLMKTPDETVGTPTASLSKSKASVYVTPGDKAGGTSSVTITNSGTGTLVIDSATTHLTGKGRKNFAITNFPTSDVSLAAGKSFTFDIKGVLAKGTTATVMANLAIAVNDASISSGFATVQLRAFDGVSTSNLSVFSQGASIRSTLTTSSVVSQLDGKDVNALV